MKVHIIVTHLEEDDGYLPNATALGNLPARRLLQIIGVFLLFGCLD